MGMITIDVRGSFRRRGASNFSALKHGHARAIRDAIAHLIDMLPEAIRQDHDLHDQGHRPEGQFGLDDDDAVR